MSNKKIENKREPVDEHPLSPGTPPRNDNSDFADINDNPEVRLPSAHHRPLSRPTAATGAIPKDLNSNVGPARRRQFQSRPYPLPGETDDPLPPATNPVQSAAVADEAGAASSSHQEHSTNTINVIHKSGPDVEKFLRTLKKPLINQMPRKIVIEPRYESSEDSRNANRNVSDAQLKHEASQQPCAIQEPSSRRLRQRFDITRPPGQRSTNQIGNPYGRVPFEEVLPLTAAKPMPMPNMDLVKHSICHIDRGNPIAPNLPDISNMTLTMNPDFVNDGVDMVENSVGQKSSEEHQRLSNIINAAGNRSSSMPPLSMPTRVMARGNIAVGAPAFIGAHPRQHAWVAVEPMPRERLGSPSTTESGSRTSNDTSENPNSSDSGFSMHDSDQNSSHLLSRGSSSSSVVFPVDNVPLRLETPTGIDELAPDEPLSDELSQPQQLSQASNVHQDELNELYYGKCAKCETEIFGEGNAVKALNKLFHKSCFVCFECEQQLDNKAFYEVKCMVFCEKDFQELGAVETAEICNGCLKPIMDIIINAMYQHYYHPKCFRCSVCSKILEGKEYTIDTNHRLYCSFDYMAKHAPRCTICHKGIYPLDDNTADKVHVVARELDYHKECYKCEFCGIRLADEVTVKCFPINDRLFCFNCNIVHQASMNMIDESKVPIPEGVPCYFA